MPKRRLFLLVGVLVLAAGVAAALQRTVFSGSAQPKRPDFQRALEQLVTGKLRVAPGATAYVSGPHGTWTGSAGFANVKAGERMPTDARMRLESVSKAWTATLILQLAAEHKLGLGDTVSHWLPGLLPYGDRITVRELLNHTSGLVDNNDIVADGEGYVRQVKDPAFRAELLGVAKRWNEDPTLEFSPMIWVRFAAALPLRTAPGTEYHYSNIGYEIAGLIAVKVSGKPLTALYDERIAQPLGLKSVAYDPQGEISGPHAHGYRVGSNGKLTDATAWHTGVGAEGGIVSNARDEARFLTGLMQGKLLPPLELAELQTAPATVASSYALGLGIEVGCAGRAYQHNGGGAGFKTSVLVSQDGSRVAVLLLNGDTIDTRADTAAYKAAQQLFCTA